MKTRRAAILTATLALLMVVVQGASRLEAHAFAPSLLELDEIEDGTFAVHWRTPLLRPSGSDLSPRLPEACRSTSPVRSQLDAKGLGQRWNVSCRELDLVGAEIGVDGLRESRTAALVRVRFRDGRESSALLTNSAPSHVLEARVDVFEVFLAYLRLGVGHIASGLDHLLFVLGLMLLVPGTRLLVATITAFTLGHSVTLVLAALDQIWITQSIVEIGIALSLLVVAVELTRADPSKQGWLRRAPWRAAFGFGLLHGLGFAGALRDTGLPSGEIPAALVSFNVGIEIGQLIFVMLILVARSLLQRLPIAEFGWLGRLPAYAIGSMACYWCLDRGAGLLFQ